MLNKLLSTKLIYVSHPQQTRGAGGGGLSIPWKSKMKVRRMNGWSAARFGPVKWGTLSVWSLDSCSSGFFSWTSWSPSKLRSFVLLVPLVTSCLLVAVSQSVPLWPFCHQREQVVLLASALSRWFFSHKPFACLTVPLSAQELGALGKTAPPSLFSHRLWFQNGTKPKYGRKNWWWRSSEWGDAADRGKFCWSVQTSKSGAFQRRRVALISTSVVTHFYFNPVRVNLLHVHLDANQHIGFDWPSAGLKCSCLPSSFPICQQLEEIDFLHVDSLRFHNWQKRDDVIKKWVRLEAGWWLIAEEHPGCKPFHIAITVAHD